MLKSRVAKTYASSMGKKNSKEETKRSDREKTSNSSSSSGSKITRHFGTHPLDYMVSVVLVIAIISVVMHAPGYPYPTEYNGISINFHIQTILLSSHDM